ncbi:hypothetical protein QBC47DRAFT_395865 [Echria macrotheca]|uniref:Uncharacterized protein n=1 Tax=Echria macrotheca TaxID=438768 RepID=A0AAJ0B3B6_9PEZI|nr:hypothetical protein QBC47DRAFT_395865 [Echria macrotheca]
MELMSTATEIRLAIYEKLLIQHDGPISFRLHYPDFRSELTKTTSGLCPALLRVSKQVYAEAISILYSKNRFRFPESPLVDNRTGPHPIAVFLDEIGPHNASLLRHVCVTLLGEGWLAKELQFRELDVLRVHTDVCIAITTLELTLTVELFDLPETPGSPVSRVSLDTVSKRLKEFPSLQRVRIDLRLLGWDMGSDADDEEGDRDGGVVSLGHDEEQQEQMHGFDGETDITLLRQLKARREALIKEMDGRGWVTNVTEVPSMDDTWDDTESWELGYHDDFMYERDQDDDSLWRHMRWDYADDGGPA